MKLHLENMKMEDLLHMELRENDLNMLASLDDWLGNLWEMLNRGYGFTIYHEEDIIACVAVTKICTGVSEIWAITGKLVDKYPKDFHKICKRIIEYAFKIDDLHRLQCTAEVGYDRTIKWLEKLGFEREGTLRNYTSDSKDMYIYSIIREGDK